MSKIKIAIVTDWLVKIGGAEKVLLDILECYPNADIYTSVYNPNLKEFHNYNVITSYLQKIPLAYKFYKLFFGCMTGAFENFNFDKYDLVINSNWALSKCILTKPKTLHIAYMHNPTRYLWADGKDYFLRSMPKTLFNLLKPSLHKLRNLDFLASRRIDKIICNSYTVQKRIQKYYRLESQVIHPASDTKYEKLNRIEKGEYYVALGRLKGFKRFDLIIKAFNKNGKKLIIIGEGEERGQLENLITSQKIKLLGYISDKARNAYLQHAKGMIFPQEEDFGITIVDALINGCPVIAYQKGGATEILNSKCGMFFKNQTYNDLNETITKFEKVNFDSEKIQNQAKNFCPTRFKKEFQKIVNQLYATHQKKHSN